MSWIMRRLPRGEAVLPLLLIALCTLMFIAWPLADMGELQRPLVGMMMVIVILCGLLTVGSNRRFAMPIVLLSLLLLTLQICNTAGLLQSSLSMTLMTECTAILFLLLLCSVLLVGVLGPGRISVNRIIGAVIIYLLFALIFSLAFDVLERLAPNAFTTSLDQHGPAQPGARFFYLSVITLTSVGFGDIAPVHPIARALVMVEAVLGQIYTTVLLGRLVSLEIVHARQQ